jgi:putative ABC transport system substrate-binding protein
MNKNIIWLILVLVIIVTGSGIFFLNGDNEQKQKKFFIGLINPNPGSQGLNEFFVDGLKKYSSKDNWKLTFQNCDNRETFAEDLKKLTASRPDLIFTVTTPGTKKAFTAFQELKTPGIFVLFDPVAAGIIKSLPHPGGNFTGVQLRGGVPKALEWLLTVKPGIKHIYVPVRFDTDAAKMSLADLKKAAANAGVKVTVDELQSKKELDTALHSIPDDIDAIFLLNSILISTNAKNIAEAGIQKKLPTAASIGKCGEGVLLSYSTRHAQSGRQASRLAYLVLRGEYPGNIPTEIADFFLCTNLQTAEKIGIKISDSVLTQSDELIH